MVGKKRTPGPPAWFKADAYRGAEAMDAGDWLLNLTLRSWLHRHPSPETEAALRGAGPLLRRGDEAQMRAMHLADSHRWVMRFSSAAWDDPFTAHDEACRRPSLPPDVWEALSDGRVGRGVYPLSVTGLYVFERMLPAEVRNAGAKFRPGDSVRALDGTLDDAFGPGPAQQQTHRFVRIDLSLPDDVLHADLRHYLKAERHRLAEMGGVQPYREAARLKLKAHELRTLATIGLLPFLDLDRWQRAARLQLSFYAVREIADIDRSHEANLRRRVKLVLNQMQLHAWFARLERSVNVSPRRRGKAK